MIKGSCLCGKIRYTYSGEITEIARCHCSQCRKAQGGAFATNSPLDANKLSFEGTEFIKEFEATGDKVRAFCTNCGSPIYSAKASLPDVARIRIGTVDTEFSCDHQYHIYSDSIASWDVITDDFRQFKEQKLD